MTKSVLCDMKGSNSSNVAEISAQIEAQVYLPELFVLHVLSAGCSQKAYLRNAAQTLLDPQDTVGPISDGANVATVRCTKAKPVTALFASRRAAGQCDTDILSVRTPRCR
jgi:hypothetical protein